jgi:8-oxo-dGTP diphosphatase
VLEETGLTVVAGRTLGESRYRVVASGREVRKRVRWWSLQVTGGDFDTSDEVDALRWLTPQRAVRTLTAGYDAEPLQRFVAEPPRTRTLLLVRHARAGHRQDFPGDDDQRPLDARGREQAAALARLLPAYGPTRLLSAPLVRCVDTLQPLSDATGLPVEPDPLLAGEAYEREPERTHERLVALVDEALNGAVVASSQGEVLPEVVRLLARGGRATEPERWEAPKASVWALSFADDGCLVDADLTDGPTG